MQNEKLQPIVLDADHQNQVMLGQTMHFNPTLNPAFSEYDIAIYRVSMPQLGDISLSFPKDDFISSDGTEVPVSIPRIHTSYIGEDNCYLPAGFLPDIKIKVSEKGWQPDTQTLPTRPEVYFREITDEHLKRLAIVLGYDEQTYFASIDEVTAEFIKKRKKGEYHPIRWNKGDDSKDLPLYLPQLPETFTKLSLTIDLK